jgi:hypothetical protein
VSWGADLDPERARTARAAIVRWIDSAESSRYDAASARALIVLADFEASTGAIESAETALERAIAAVTRAGDRTELTRALAATRTRVEARRGNMSSALEHARESADQLLLINLMQRSGRGVDALAKAKALVDANLQLFGPVHARTLAARRVLHFALIEVGDLRGALDNLEETRRVAAMIHQQVELYRWQEIVLGIRLHDQPVVDAAASSLTDTTTAWVHFAEDSLANWWNEAVPYALDRARAQTTDPEWLRRIDDLRAYDAFIVGDHGSVLRLVGENAANGHLTVPATNTLDGPIGRLPGPFQTRGAMHVPISPWLIAVEYALRGDSAPAIQRLAALASFHDAPGDYRRADSRMFDAWVLRALGRKREALSLLREARAIHIAMDDRSPDRAETSAWLGVLLVELDQPAAAIEPLEDALACQRCGSFHYFFPMAQFSLARALWDSGQDQETARLLATAARDGYARLGQFRAPERRQADDWLAGHPPAN